MKEKMVDWSLDSREDLAEELGRPVEQVSELVWDIYCRIADEWDLLPEITYTQLRHLLAEVCREFNWDEYFQQIDFLAEQVINSPDF